MTTFLNKQYCICSLFFSTSLSVPLSSQRYTTFRLLSTRNKIYTYACVCNFFHSHSSTIIGTGYTDIRTSLYIHRVPNRERATSRLLSLSKNDNKTKHLNSTIHDNKRRPRTIFRDTSKQNNREKCPENFFSSWNRNTVRAETRTRRQNQRNKNIPRTEPLDRSTLCLPLERISEA